jgi:hypothetical protein
MRRLSRSEKTLAGVVGALLFALLNLALASYVAKQRAALRIQTDDKTAQIKVMRELFSEQALWSRREAWLKEKQPKLANESSAGVQLLEQVRQIAKSNEVQLENPAIGAQEKTAWCRSVPVQIEAKCSWPALIAFLRAIQQPDQFVVLENATVEIDSGDPSLMRGKFKIARWYAP